MTCNNVNFILLWLGRCSSSTEIRYERPRLTIRGVHASGSSCLGLSHTLNAGSDSGFFASAFAKLEEGELSWVSGALSCSCETSLSAWAWGEASDRPAAASNAWKRCSSRSLASRIAALWSTRRILAMSACSSCFHTIRGRYWHDYEAVTHSNCWCMRTCMR